MQTNYDGWFSYTNDAIYDLRHALCFMKTNLLASIFINDFNVIEYTTEKNKIMYVLTYLNILFKNFQDFT